MDWLLSVLILAIPSALAMGLVRLMGVKRWWWLLLAAVVGGSLAGVFIASAASAMATAVNPQMAMLRGGLIGLVAGLLVGTLFLLIGTAVTRSRSVR